MVNELRDLLREAADGGPQDTSDLAPVLRTGRRRVRVRRARVLGGTALATAASVAVTSFVLADPDPVTAEPAGVPRAEGPVLRLADAKQAKEGRDYRVVTSYTNENLDRENGQYLDGVTDDGLVLFRDGPRRTQLYPRYALMDPVTEEKDWLPRLDVGQDQLFPLELSEDRLVLLSLDNERATADFSAAPLVAHVFDRGAARWTEVEWSGLPPVAEPFGDVGPDGRLYLRVPATRGAIPEGGWPVGPDGEAEDADAEGDTFDLWSVSLEDSTDARDERMRVGAVAFTDEAMVWTDSSGGQAGRVHVRDVESGEEIDFDPRTGERCNLLGFGASGDRIVMSQYCGTYEDGVRDDRVQVLSTAGELVTTIQDNGVEGGPGALGNDTLGIVSYDRDRAGHYVYDLDTGTFLRLSDGLSKWGLPILVPDGVIAWHTPVNRGHGATQWVAELSD